MGRSREVGLLPPDIASPIVIRRNRIAILRYESLKAQYLFVCRSNCRFELLVWQRIEIRVLVAYLCRDICDLCTIRC
ncbi:hypothetical protein [Pandoraea cepalis]|uniref:Uncharacterized protein n=1 Tax=Pandoraea cepalis TaxID=2508294 RepID=A0A5E4V6R9_9BURK|nr:hypothetical protein [Pandoraea cepalis]VVE07928.1 hypothetical protein PCE31107_02494 [Pandoraea cepalis]